MEEPSPYIHATERQEVLHTVHHKLSLYTTETRTAESLSLVLVFLLSWDPYCSCSLPGNVIEPSKGKRKKSPSQTMTPADQLNSKHPYQLKSSTASMSFAEEFHPDQHLIPTLVISGRMNIEMIEKNERHPSAK